MNIKKAKEMVKDAVYLYLKKDSKGRYIIPSDKQRPLFILGAPGVGKTAIISQVADELDVAYVSYSMTHHTRQSALGLPKIESEQYEDMEYDISRYTMSEIIASVYDAMRLTGKKEGILFLDEINCVSESLSPSMLMFLQFKIFGSYSVPQGWVIITAGNPPEYNRQVRDFDVVTLDRLRVIEVEESYEAFRDYAIERNLHPAIISYLDNKKEHFYVIDNSPKGKRYVTARGWEDLSRIIVLSEKENISVNRELVYQYIRHADIASEFSSYYELFVKYRSDYNVKDILSGNVTEDVLLRGKEASFDERLAIIELMLQFLRSNCAIIKVGMEELEKDKQSDNFDKETFVHNVNKLKEKALQLKDMFDNAFIYSEKAFSDNEIMILAGELGMNTDTSWFLVTFGSERYTANSSRLMLTDKGEELKEKCSRILASIETK